MDRKWLRSTVTDLQLYYNPNIQGSPLRMDTNTNPLGENPACKQALKECLDMDLEQYPSTYGDKLRQELANFYNLHRDNFVVGNGSDEVLDILFKTFMEPGGNVVMAYPAYSLHGWFAIVNGGGAVEVDLKPNFQLDVDAMLRAKGNLVIVCTPNNPTSNTFKKDDVLRLVEESKRPVVVDEAYGEFAGESFIPLVDKYPNLIVTRTFSKAYALAGMRIGYAVSNKEMTLAMQKVKIPYSLNKVAEHIGVKALQDQEFVRKTVSVVNSERKRLEKGLTDLGFHVFPSEANFILFRCPRDSAETVKRLAVKHVLIRDFGKKRMLENCARTTIGTREQNDELLLRLGEVMKEWL
ncbi:MAG: Aspartate aminotransferase [Methanomassiliicoccales archaeon PtaU1.Bin124]|nr:MAG: Aspartate aminotransferase [Methanomassiliicoccales archaeon PtaU1.Bin124]